ncbi:helix-turn-helix transcriptional regulator [Halocola ammonii]
MAANKYALLRYRIIDRCLTNSARPFPSKEDLREACEESLFGSSGENVSISTIEKDMWAMKNESELGFYAPIAYNPQERGYYYEDPEYTIQNISLNDEDLNAIRFAVNTLEQFRDMPIFSQFGNAIGKITDRLKISPDVQDAAIGKYVQFEQAPEVGGTEFLAPLLDAIKSRKSVKFNYQKFSTDELKSYHLDPYLLKEYRNRWYVIGYSPAREDFLTFGLDRLSNLDVGDQKFEVMKSFNADRFFRHSIGITEGGKEPEDIVLEFAPVQGKYILSSPLHHSQQVINEDSIGITISLHALITFELVQQLLSFGSSVKVKEPSELRERLIKEHKKAISIY